MGLSEKQSQNISLEKIHHYLKNSFTNVKKDTSTLFQWIQFLHQKIEHQEKTIHELKTELKNQLSQQILAPEEIKQLIDSHYTIQNTKNIHLRLHDLSKKLNILANMHDSHNSRLNDIHSRLNNLHKATERKTTSLKEKLVKKLTRNSKNYVKNLILSLIEKYHEISALQLKEMLVEEQQVCSKSSFYRLLQELEDQEKVNVAKEGKQKLYFVKPLAASK